MLGVLGALLAVGLVVLVALVALGDGDENVATGGTATAVDEATDTTVVDEPDESSDTTGTTGTEAATATTTTGVTPSDDVIVGDIDNLVDEFELDFTLGVSAAGPASCETTGDGSTGIELLDNYTVDAIVTNNDGETSHYRLDYELVGPSGEILGVDYGIVSGVEPGTTVRDDTIGIINGDPEWTAVTCNVLTTSRLVAN